jgi:hypothetical protein
MELLGARDIEEALTRVGELLVAATATYAVVVLGGAALNLLGIVDRTTRDVDVLAFGVPVGERPPTEVIPPTEPLPEPLRRAVEIVARDLALPLNWMNTGPALQWRQGLPPGLARRVHWRSYGEPGVGGLWVGLVDRYDLAFFKLYAAADSTGPQSVHYQDLLALAPTAEELVAAAAWVHDQDASPAFHGVLDQVVNLVHRHLARGPGADSAP